jgi:hypothetical protein
VVIKRGIGAQSFNFYLTAFKVPTGHLAAMLKADVKAAGIDYRYDAGRVVDFHALRHTAGTPLAATGAHPKVAQSLMRHSDINLTTSRYSHVLIGQESDAVAALPDLAAPPAEAVRDTRTAGPEPAPAAARNRFLCIVSGPSRKASAVRPETICLVALGDYPFFMKMVNSLAVGLPERFHGDRRRRARSRSGLEGRGKGRSHGHAEPQAVSGDGGLGLGRAVPGSGIGARP